MKPCIVSRRKERLATVFFLVSVAPVVGTGCGASTERESARAERQGYVTTTCATPSPRGTAAAGAPCAGNLDCSAGLECYGGTCVVVTCDLAALPCCEIK